MNIPPNNSLFWPYVKVFGIAAFTLIAISVGYREGFVAKTDIPVILGVALPYLGIELTHRLATKAKK